MSVRVRMQSEPVERFLASLQAIRQDLDRLPEATVRIVLGEIERLRVQTAALLVAADPASFDAYRQRELVRRLEDLSARFVERYGQVLALPQGLTFEAGQRLAAEPLVDAGVAYAVPQASRRQLEVAQAFQAALITNAVEDTITRVSIELRLGVLRGESVFEVAGRIAGSLESPGPFGSLATRAEAITRTELGRIQAIATQAGLEESQRFVPDLQKQWQHSGNTGRYRRLGHVEAQDQVRDVGAAYRVRPQPGRPYEELLYPRDPSASPASTIFCFLPGTQVRGRFIGALKAGYSGPAREIHTARGHRLRVTPNHPVLTSVGWMAAIDIQKGQYLLRDRGDVGAPARNTDAENGPASVEQVFHSFSSQGVASTPPRRSLDLHGDSIWTNGDVEITGSYRELLLDLKAEHPEGAGEFNLIPEDSTLTGVVGAGAPPLLPRRVLHASTGGMSRGHLTRGSRRICLESLPDDAARLGCVPEPDLCELEARREGPPRDSGPSRYRQDGLAALVQADQLRQLGDFHSLSFGHSPELDMVLAEVRRQRPVGNAGGFLEIHEAFSPFIAADEVTDVRDIEHRGHVYDLQSVPGVLLADSLIVSNCGCLSIPYRAAWADALKEAA